MKLGASDKTIFVQGPYLAYRLILAVVVSLVLIFVDVRFSYLDPVRSVVSSALTPIHWLSDLPIAFSEGFTETFTSRDDLQDKLDLMESRMLVLERKAQKLASVTAELNRLRELLNASRVLDDGVVVSEMIGVSPDADNQYILLNKGAQDKVYLGQAVLDSKGLMGQVIEVNEFTSRVLLISDSRHAVPVQVNRNGVRAIAYGVGALDYLELENVPDTSDIVVGDLLVSSGLGGRFPEGYPVARVSSIEHHAGRSFASVKAVPEAQLNRSRLLLLVFNQTSQVQNSSADVSDDVASGEQP